MTTVISGSSPSITFSDATTQTTAFTTPVSIANGGTGSSTLAGANIATTNSSTQSITSINTFGFKNRIINGAMAIDQRGSGSALTISPSNSGYYGIDRYTLYANPSGAAGTWTWQQLSATPPSGFTYYGRATVTTPDSSVTGTDYYSIQQPIEGYNLADIDFGTANAKAFTVSFWVRSSLTGTFSCAVNFATSTNGYPLTYTINSPNTWEFKTINFPAITNSVIATTNKTNGVGLYLVFSLGIGNSYTGASGTLGSLVYGASGTTNLISTNGATFDITGIQLEVGTQATSFDFRDYGSELILCQRYYQTVTLNGCPSAVSYTHLTLPTKRIV